MRFKDCLFILLVAFAIVAHWNITWGQTAESLGGAGFDAVKGYGDRINKLSRQNELAPRR